MVGIMAAIRAIRAIRHPRTTVSSEYGNGDGRVFGFGFGGTDAENKIVSYSTCCLVLVVVVV